MTRVRSRDGTLQDYDEGKIAHEILLAMQSAGEENAALAGELAQLVTFLIEKYHGRDNAETVVEPRQVADMIEQVLLNSNAPPNVAKAFIVRRQRRAEVESTVTVHKPGYGQRTLFPDDTITVETDSTAEAHHWDRAKIQAALIRECDLPPAVASTVAEQVESRVFASGLKRITTGLIRELINAELFALGLNQARERQSIVGLPKFDLEAALLRGKPEDAERAFRDPSDVDRFVHDAVWRRYALQEIHSPEVAAAHVDGRLHLHGLNSPLRLDSLRVCPEGLKHGWPHLPTDVAGTDGSGRQSLADRVAAPATEEQFLALLRRYAEECAEMVNERVTFANFSLVLAPLVARRDAEGRRSLLRRAIGALSGRQANRLVLEFPLDVSERFREAKVVGLRGVAEEGAVMAHLGGVVRELARDAVLLLLEGTHQALLAPDLVLVVDGQTLSKPDVHSILELAADCASRHGAPRFAFMRHVWPTKARLSATEWRHRLGADALHYDHEASILTVTLNLPQAAFRAGRGGHDAFNEECEQLVDLARKAVRERVQFQFGALARMAHPLLAVGKNMDRLHPATLDLGTSFGRVALAGLAEAAAYLNAEPRMASPALGLVTRNLTERPADANTRAGLRAVSYLSFELRRQQAPHDVELRLAEGRDGAVLERFRRINTRTYPRHAEALKREIGLRDDRYTAGISIPGSAEPLACLEREGRFHTMLDAGAEIVVPPALPSHTSSTVLELIRQAVLRHASVHGLAVPVFAVSCPSCGECRATPLALPTICPACGHNDIDFGWLVGNRFLLNPVPELPRAAAQTQ